MSDSKTTAGTIGSSYGCPTLSLEAGGNDGGAAPVGNGGLPDDPEETRVTCSVLCSLGGALGAAKATTAVTTTTTSMSAANSASSTVQDDDMAHEQLVPQSCSKRICPKQHQLPMFLSSKS